MYCQSFFVISVRGIGLEPTTALSASSGCIGFMNAAFGVRFFFAGAFFAAFFTVFFLRAFFAALLRTALLFCSHRGFSGVVKGSRSFVRERVRRRRKV